MQSPAERAHRILGRQPTPAVPVRELHRLLSGETGGPPPPFDLFLHMLRRRPDLFRVLDPWRGPWEGLRPAGRGPAGRAPGGRGPAKRWTAGGLEIGGAWVVPADGSGGLDEEPDPAARTLRASVAVVGRGVDEASVTALSRWMAMVREAQRVRRWIFRQRAAAARTG